MVAEEKVYTPEVANFVQRNITNCCRSSSTSTTVSNGLAISGVPIILIAKSRFASGRTKFPVKTSAIDIQDQIVDKTDGKLTNKKNIPKSSSAKKTYSGIRRTSIKQKGEIQNKPEAGQEETEQIGKCSARKEKRSLKLRVANITLPVHNSGKSLPTFWCLSSIAAAAWETLDRHWSIESKQRLERLLSNMTDYTELQRKSRDKSNGIPRVTTEETDSLRCDKEENPTRTNENSADYLNHVYNKVYRNHLDALTTIIANENVKPPTEAHSKNGPKKKVTPRLEIKIGGNPSFQNMKITHGLEECSPLEELDNCGNVTPVITYNHVSSDNATVPFGVAQEESRSPSPLLEVPDFGEEITTKRPTDT